MKLTHKFIFFLLFFFLFDARVSAHPSRWPLASEHFLKDPVAGSSPLTPDAWLKHLEALQWNAYTSEKDLTLLSDMAFFLREGIRQHKQDPLWISRFVRELHLLEKRNGRVQKKIDDYSSSQKMHLHYLIAGLGSDLSLFWDEKVSDENEGSSRLLLFSVEDIQKHYQKALDFSEPLSKLHRSLLEEKTRWILNLYSKLNFHSYVFSALEDFKKLKSQPLTDELCFLYAKTLYHGSWLFYEVESPLQTLDQKISLAKAAIEEASLCLHNEKLRPEILEFIADVRAYLATLELAKNQKLPSTALSENTLQSSLENQSLLLLQKEAYQKEKEEKAQALSQEMFYILIAYKTDYLWELTAKDSLLKDLPLKTHPGEESHNQTVAEIWEEIRKANPDISDFTQPIVEKTAVRFPIGLLNRFKSLSAIMKSSENSEMSEAEKIAAYRRAIQNQISRLKKIEPKTHDLELEIRTLTLLLDRAEPVLELKELEKIYPLCLEESDPNLEQLVLFLQSQEYQGIFEAHNDWDFLAYLISWSEAHPSLFEKKLMDEAFLILWKKKLMVYHLLQFFQNHKTEKPVLQKIFQHMTTLLLEEESLSRLNELWTLTQKANSQENAPEAWLLWLGQEHCWAWIEKMSDEELFLFLRDTPDFLNKLLVWALQNSKIGQGEFLNWQKRFLVLKLKNLPIPPKDLSLPKELLPTYEKLAQGIQERASLKSFIQDLEKEMALLQNPNTQITDLAKSLGNLKTLEKVTELQSETFFPLWKAHPEMIDELHTLAEALCDERPELLEKLNKLLLISKIRTMDTSAQALKEKYDLTDDEASALSGLLDRIKLGGLDFLSLDRLASLLEYLDGEDLSDLIEWIGPERLAELMLQGSADSYARLSKLFIRLLESGKLDLDLRKYGPLIESLARYLAKTDPQRLKNFLEGLKDFNLRGFNFEGWDLNWNLPKGLDFDGIDFPKLKLPDIQWPNFKFDFELPDLGFDFKKWFSGPSLSSIDYDFEDYRDDIHDLYDLSTEIGQCFANDLTLAHFSDPAYRNGQNGFSLKAAEILLSLRPFEPPQVLEDKDPPDEKMEKEIYHYKTSFDFEYFPALRWLQAAQFNMDAWESVQKKSPELTVPVATKAHVFEASYRLIDQQLTWLRIRAEKAKRIQRGRSFFALRFTLEELHTLFIVTRYIHARIPKHFENPKFLSLDWSLLGQKWAEVTNLWLEILIFRYGVSVFDQKTFDWMDELSKYSDLVTHFQNAAQPYPQTVEPGMFPGLYEHEVPKNLKHVPSFYIPHAFEIKPLESHEQRFGFFLASYEPFLEILQQGGDPERLCEWAQVEFEARNQALTSKNLLSLNANIRNRAEEERALAFELLFFWDMGLVQKLLFFNPKQGGALKAQFSKNVLEGIRYFKAHPPTADRHYLLVYTLYPITYHVERLIYVLSFMDATREERRELVQYVLSEIKHIDTFFSELGFPRWGQRCSWQTVYEILISWFQLKNEENKTVVRDYSNFIPVLEEMMPEILRNLNLPPQKIMTDLFNIEITAYNSLDFILKRIEWLNHYIAQFHDHTPRPSSQILKHILTTSKRSYNDISKKLLLYFESRQKSKPEEKKESPPLKRRFYFKNLPIEAPEVLGKPPNLVELVDDYFDEFLYKVEAPGVSLRDEEPSDFETTKILSTGEDMRLIDTTLQGACSGEGKVIQDDQLPGLALASSVVFTKGLKNTLVYYRFVTWLYPLGRAVFPQYFSTLRELGLAMIHSAAQGYEKQILEVPDILALSKRGGN